MDPIDDRDCAEDTRADISQGNLFDPPSEGNQEAVLFAKIGIPQLADDNLNDADIRVLAALHAFAWDQCGGGRGWFYALNEEIAMATSKEARSIERILRGLRRLRLVEMEYGIEFFKQRRMRLLIVYKSPKSPAETSKKTRRVERKSAGGVRTDAEGVRKFVGGVQGDLPLDCEFAPACAPASEILNTEINSRTEALASSAGGPTEPPPTPAQDAPESEAPKTSALSPHSQGNPRPSGAPKTPDPEYYKPEPELPPVALPPEWRERAERERARLAAKERK